jgi:hypothetical protein
MSRKRKIRRAQTVSPFGVGAIYDFGDESFVAKDTLSWRGTGDVIRLPRLARYLRVKQFRAAPTPRGRFDPNPPRVPFFRFPQWLFCPRCKRMVRWNYTQEVADEPPTCADCQSRPVLAPMRFVMICRNGHMGDVPWDYWAHSNAQDPRQKQCREKKLSFEAVAGRGGGLESIQVRCRACGAQRSLEGIARKDGLRPIGVRCTGRQPWQSTGVNCDEVPQVVQRGASNLYYSRVESALDIPDHGMTSEDDPMELRITNHPAFRMLKTVAASIANPADDPAIKGLCEQIAPECNCRPEQVLAAALTTGTQTAQQAAPAPTMEELLEEEWHAFMSAGPRGEEKQPFVAEDALLGAFLNAEAHNLHSLSALGGLFARVVLAKRLREVRALDGFERYEPGEVVKPWLQQQLDWLPAAEVYGEGIFLALNEQELRRWEENLSAHIDTRIADMKARHHASGLDFIPEPTARFVLLHTLSHLLIRQLSFDCGYSASSLRERIYSREPTATSEGMAGILVYTADSDSEGSLGGLVRQGDPKLLLPALGTMLQSARWCSSDPICSELPGQGLRGLNKAACHACALVSETSCTCCNVLLDRSLLTGVGADTWGFFGPFLEAVDAEHVAE